MHFRVRFLAALFCGVLIMALASGGTAQAEDEYALLPDGEGKDYVYGVCSGCHSIRLVVQQGLTRKRWDYMLDWMVEEQGMAELDEETRAIVLDYLDTYLNTDRELPAPVGQ